VPAGEIDGVEVAAVAARDTGRAEAYAERYNIPTVHESYEALVADDSLDAIYNPLVPSGHAEWSIKALEHGKHVLCEKPFAMNAGEAKAMVETARRQNLVLMEAFHWRYHPVADAMLDVVSQLGQLQRGEAAFAFNLQDRDRWLYDASLGGGASMDLGCYPVHWMRTVAGEEPEVVSASAVEEGDGVDVSMEAELQFPSGFRARTRCSMVEPVPPGREGMVRYVVVEGTGGRLRVDNPLAPQDGHRLTAEFTDGRQLDQTYTLRTTYLFQLEAFLDAVAGTRPAPTTGDDIINNMATIDAIYRAAGMMPRGET
jgi:predicted dehydrogenase